MPRLKEYDDQVVLKRAMHIFWKQGYNGTSMQDLVDAMRINRFSLYDSFGDKEKLYLTSLSHYVETIMQPKIQSLENSESPIKGIRKFFQAFVDNAKSGKSRYGCMMINMCVEMGPKAKKYSDFAAKYLSALEQVFQRVLVRGQKVGVLSNSKNTKDLAKLLVGLVLSTMTLAKSRPPLSALKAHVKAGLSVLN